jgi:hypothetical protein
MCIDCLYGLIWTLLVETFFEAACSVAKKGDNTRVSEHRQLGLGAL